MKDAVTKSSPGHSVEQTRSSTWEVSGVAGDSEMERHSAASGTLVVVTISPTGSYCVESKVN